MKTAARWSRAASGAAFLAFASTLVFVGVTGFSPPAVIAGATPPRLLTFWDGLPPDSEPRQRVLGLVEMLAASGLNDPGSPVRIEPPLPPEPAAAAVELLARLSGSGVRTLIEPGGGTLARAVDDRLPRAVASPGPPRFTLTVRTGPVESVAGNLRAVHRLVVQNVSGELLRSVSVLTMVSSLEGPIGASPRLADDPRQTVHVMRVAPGALGLRSAGDLLPGAEAALEAPFDPADLTDRRSTHLYYIVLFEDGSGTLRTDLVAPRSVDGLGDAPWCPAPRDGALVMTGQPACTWDDCASVQGKRLAYITDEWAAGDLNGDGDQYDSFLAAGWVGSTRWTIIDSAWVSRLGSDVLVWILREQFEGEDRNGDGDLSDTVAYWYRLSTGQRGGPFTVRDLPRVSDPWIAFETPEADYGVDVNGDGDLDDDVVQAVDTRTNAIFDTAALGSWATPGTRALFFTADERDVGQDLDGDGDLLDFVLQWTPYPGVAGLEPGVHNTGLGSTNGFVYSAGSDLATISASGGAGRLAGVYVGATDAEAFRYEAFTWLYDGSRLVWALSSVGPAVMRDFATGDEQVLDIAGWPARLRGDLLVWERWWSGNLELSLRHLASGDDRVIGYTHFNWFDYDVSMSNEFISWHNDVRTACYPFWAGWMEVHRVGTGVTHRTDASGYKYSIGSAGRHVVAFTEPEGWAGLERDGRPGLTGWNLTYYVPPCRSFAELDTHIELAITSSPEVNARLAVQARRASDAWRAGRVRDARAGACTLFRQLTVPQEAQIEDISRQMVRGCVMSAALTLGIVPTEDACGVADNCPGVPNPMQDDFDGDGAGGVCDVCPTIADPEQRDADADGRGDACDLCPLVASPNDEDRDSDGRGNACDNCPYGRNPDQADRDLDGTGDVCDPCPDDPANDVDGDGRCAARDNCPTVWNADQADADGDGIGDACDPTP